MSIVIELVISSGFNIVQFSMRTVYLAWIVLSAAAILCFLKDEKIIKLNRWIQFGLCILVFLIVEFFTQYFIFEAFDVDRFARLFAAAVVICLLVFRLFELFSLYESRSISKLEARMQGLQSKIEPHFLFNSLNSIAELAHIDADQAENSIQSLASLLRTNLTDDSHMHSLADEISITRHYIQLERLRLGDRVRLNWQDDLSDSQKRTIVIPKLTLQPLVENALRYGVAPSAEGGDVDIQISISTKRLKVKIINSKPGGSIHPEAGGTGIALNNIRERLLLIYDDQHKFSVSENKSSYTAQLEIPKQVDRWRG